jgi:hypothetical protein
MSIFNWFSRKKKAVEEVEETFVFEVHEAVKVGDLYTYTVKAKNKDEAFKKLVEKFYGNGSDESIKSDHHNTTYPNHSVFTYKNMPKWFAKRISGHVKDESCNYQKELEKYCIDNNIELNTRKI